jgi:hypothetical protein
LISPADIDYINAHATSTPAGDRSESLALHGVFTHGARPCVSSTKALAGHGLSLDCHEGHTTEGFPLTWIYRWQWRKDASQEEIVLTLGHKAWPWVIACTLLQSLATIVVQFYLQRKLQ